MTALFLLAGASFLTLGDAQFILDVLAPLDMGMRKSVLKCDAAGANFGADTWAFAMSQAATGCIKETDPVDACKKVKIVNDKHLGPPCLFNFALSARGNCSFSEKAYYVQFPEMGKFHALIVYNNKDEDAPTTMSGSKYADKILIPVIMVSYHCMKMLLLNYTVEKGFVVQIQVAPGYYDLFRYLIPFVIVVGFCFSVLCVSLLIRICRERRRLARKRLSKKNLKKIPTRQYKLGDEPETCAICLDDFEPNEKVRILPCRHVYHCKCIDPWLTKNRKVCPMCKRRVGDKASDSEDSDSGPSRVLVDQSRYRQLREELPSDPAPSTSTVLTEVDVHHVDDRDTTRLVSPNSEVEEAREDLASEEVLVSPSSLKERMLAFVGRVKRHANLQEALVPVGLDNVAFDANSVASASTSATELQDPGPSQSSTSASASDATSAQQFADPFERLPPSTP